MVRQRSNSKIASALFATSVVILAFLPSCSSGEQTELTTDETILPEEEGYLEPEELDSLDIEEATENDVEDPDESVSNLPDLPWDTQFANGPQPQAVYTCTPCNDSNCYTSTYTNRKSFAIKSGTHLYGGGGNDRGAVNESELEINRGMSKFMYIGGNRVKMGFAFRAKMFETNPDDNNQPYQLSGWIRLDALTTPITMKACDNPERAPDKFYYRHKSAASMKALYDKYNKFPWNLRVDPGGKRYENLLVHYLSRKDSGGKYAVNVIQGPPNAGRAGIANDSFTVDPDPAKNKRFRATRSNTDNLEMRVLLYTAKENDTDKSVYWTGCGEGKKRCYDKFVYVRIGTNRYGWIAKRAFTNKVKATSSSNPTGGMTPCGEQDIACCAPDNSCSNGLVCNGSTCVLCGSLGEPCCSTGCEQGVCTNGSCQDIPPPPCGAAGQPCCSGTCNGDRLICDGAQVCQPCGSHAQTCCPSGAACTNASPESNQVCKANTNTCGSQCYARCIDGTLEGPYDAASAADCLAWSDGACSNDNGKGRVEINGTNIFDNMQCGGLNQMCCAGDVCKNGYKCKTSAEPYWKACGP